MNISKFATQPNHPEEKNPSFIPINSILLSGYVIAECSIVKRKETNQLQWEITRSGKLEVEGRRLVG
jgi:hypothetical protein